MSHPFKFFCAFLLFALNVFARGGDVVGNGGGIAELQLTKIWSQLDTELQRCLSKQNLCGLDSNQLGLVHAIIADRAFHKPATIDFFFDPQKNLPALRIDGFDEPVFNADKLYVSPGHPVSLSIIMQDVAAAQLMILQHKVSLNDALIFGKAVGQFWASTNKVYEGTGADVRLVIAQARIDSGFAYEIYYQSGDVAYDLTGLFRDAFPCPLRAGGLNILSAAFVESARVANFNGHLTYTCEDGTSARSRYQVNVLPDARFTVDLFD